MQKRIRHAEAGNVLFLILIAVVLFAALSYAVSQTMRSSGNSGPGQETGKIDSAYLIQFPTSVRQAVVRMKLSRNLANEDISFAHPGDTTYGTFGTVPTKELFHPQGGAVVYESPPSQINDGTQWVFNGNIEINGQGTTSGTSSSADLVAFLPGIRRDVCRYVNQGFDGGAPQTPPTVTIAGETTPFTGTFGYTATLTNPALDGKDSYCYYSGTLSKYVFYQVLISR